MRIETNIAGEQTGLFGAKTCVSGCEELEAIDGRREGKQV